MPQLSTISRWYDPLDLKPGDVDERDLAVSLSHLCRFNGHIDKFYSVAQHSIAVARLVEVRGGDSPTVLQALLHDASEAYLCGDIPGPLKRSISFYTDHIRDMSIRDLEWDMRVVIHQALGCEPPTEEREEMVHKADRDMLKVEVLHLKPEALHPDFHKVFGSAPEDAKGVGLTTHGYDHPLHVQIHFSDEFSRLKGLLK